MSKTKAGGRAKQKTRRPGKRLGVKLYGGQKTETGQIIVRQRGSSFHAGEGVSTGRDFTLFAKNPGTVAFKVKKGRKVVSVIRRPQENSAI
ncbi:MAG: 50S ribosomal protein L27 [bacterium]|nr:50S ribosomal protein L27 [bacterium]